MLTARQTVKKPFQYRERDTMTLAPADQRLIDAVLGQGSYGTVPCVL